MQRGSDRTRSEGTADVDAQSFDREQGGEERTPN